MCLCFILDQWRIQDFPERGAPTLKGALTYYLPNFSQKLHENEEILAGGGAHPWCPTPLDMPLWIDVDPVLSRVGVPLGAVQGSPH